VRITEGEVVFDYEDVPSVVALQNSALDTGVPAESIEAIIANTQPKDFGTNESRWVAALYVNALISGKTFDDLIQPVKISGGRLVREERFNAQLARFSEPDPIAFFFCKFPTLQLSGVSASNNGSSPTHEELADYYALIRSLYPAEMLTTVTAMMADDIVQPISPVLLQKTLKLQKELIVEGEVLPLRQLRICAAMWNADEVVRLLVNKIPLNEAVEMVVQGATDVNEIIQFKNDIPQIWLDEIFNF